MTNSKTALKIMEHILQIHNYYWNDGTKWSSTVKPTIERRRIANKTKALIAHDRYLTGRYL